MPRYDFDMITIGAGSGGVASSRRAGSYGARVAIAQVDQLIDACVVGRLRGGGHAGLLELTEFSGPELAAGRRL